MAKRKAHSDSEEEAILSDDSEPKVKHKSQSKKKKASDSGGDAPTTSTAKAMSPPTKEKETIRKNSEGEKYIDLGKKRRATVRAFKDILLLDIREFYGEDEKPGKKGISLTLDQWQALKANGDTIDSLFTELKSKK